MSFRVFNALLYSGMPAIDWMTSMIHLNQNGNPPSGPLVPTNSEGYFFFDWEPDYLDAPYLGYTDAAAASTVVNSECLSLISAARTAAPKALVGVFDLPAHTGYPQNAQWQQIMQPLLEVVDFCAPQLYNSDIIPWVPNWISYATMRVAEFRALCNKPVYGFLWNRYTQSPNAMQPIRDWKIQLQWCRENCDGIVLWGGYQEQWSSEAAWWQATKQVMGI